MIVVKDVLFFLVGPAALQEGQVELRHLPVVVGCWLKEASFCGCWFDDVRELCRAKMVLGCLDWLSFNNQSE